MKIRTHRQSGFSLLEVCVVLVLLALLVVAVLSALSRTSQRPAGIICMNNLKQTGLSFRLWSNDHGDQFPWASTNSAGTFALANSPQVFRHFLAVSNELVSPKILACPTDTAQKRVTDFTKFSNANLSYFVALDADQTKPNRLLSGDRNIIGGNLSNGFLRLLNPSQNDANWTSAMHNNYGNVGLADGSATQANPRWLREQLQRDTLPIIRLAIP